MNKVNNAPSAELPSDEPELDAKSAKFAKVLNVPKMLPIIIKGAYTRAQNFLTVYLTTFVTYEIFTNLKKSGNVIARVMT